MSENSQQYKILVADIYADRFDGKTIDISKQIVELNLFENLENAYLSGTIALVDDVGLLDRIGFRGSEKFRLQVSSVDNERKGFLGGNVTENDEEGKYFHFTKIEKSTRANDRTEVHLLHFIEEHMFTNNLIRISKAFTSSIENIITQIIIKNLKRKVDQSYLEPSAQGVRKINIPFLKPIEAIEFLKDRITSASGFPYFVYASLFDDNIRIGNTDLLLSQESFNSRQPFVYSSANSTQGNELPEDQRAFIIEAFKSKQDQDTLHMLQKGALVSTYNNIDLNSGLVSSNKYEIANLVRDMEKEKFFGEETIQNVFDPNHIVDNKFINEYAAKTHHQVTSFGTYDQFLGYHDVQNEKEHLLKLRAYAIRNLMYRNMINVVVPGTALAYKKISVGDQVNLTFLNSQQLANASNVEDSIDKSKSGDWLIYAARHVFKDSRHFVSLNLTKLKKIKNV